MAFVLFVLLVVVVAIWVALGLLAGRASRVRAANARLEDLDHPERGRLGVWIAKDRQFPFPVRLLPLTAFVYWVTPFDVIPDAIPKIGFLDDRAVLGYALWLTLYLGPRDRFEEHLQRAEWYAARARALDAGEEWTEEEPPQFPRAEPSPAARPRDLAPETPRRDPFDDPEKRREPGTGMPWL